ncbi:MAG TPA: hypothetical protein VMW86_06320 [Dehalococcoidales bacterium]|nr:hypothetical protein [Dehalococcoidales bacterium]
MPFDVTADIRFRVEDDQAKTEEQAKIVALCDLSDFLRHHPWSELLKVQRVENGKVEYRTEVYVENEWVGNALVFPTRDEADGYAAALKRAWILVKDYRVVETNEAANYHWVGPGNFDIVEIK